MAITNAEIIATECSLRGIMEEVHTFQRWKAMGYMVKKGEKAVFKTTIWKAVPKNDEEKEVKLFMKSAAFFKASQVQPLS
jgi:hypothetical protein